MEGRARPRTSQDAGAFGHLPCTPPVPIRRQRQRPCRCKLHGSASCTQQAQTAQCLVRIICCTASFCSHPVPCSTHMSLPLVRAGPMLGSTIYVRQALDVDEVSVTVSMCVPPGERHRTQQLTCSAMHHHPSVLSMPDSCGCCLLLPPSQGPLATGVLTAVPDGQLHPG